jgi:hypothetical protein
VVPFPRRLLRAPLLAIRAREGVERARGIASNDARPPLASLSCARGSRASTATSAARPRCRVIRGHGHHRCPKAFLRIHGPNTHLVSDYKGLSVSRERLSRGMVVVGTPRPTTTRCLARARARGARRERHRSSCHRRARSRRARCARGRADSRARVV